MFQSIDGVNQSVSESLTIPQQLLSLLLQMSCLSRLFLAVESQLGPLRGDDGLLFPAGHEDCLCGGETSEHSKQVVA